MGTYTVPPTLAGYSFVPVSQTFSNVTANPTANFRRGNPRCQAVWLTFAGCPAGGGQQFCGGARWSRSTGRNRCAEAASAATTLPDRISACIVQVDG